MDIGWIDDLIAIEEKGSLSKAAEYRNVTQPAFWRRIAAIEHWFGADIVNRSNRPLRLTAEMADMMPTLHDVADALVGQDRRPPHAAQAPVGLFGRRGCTIAQPSV